MESVKRLPPEKTMQIFIWTSAQVVISHASEKIRKKDKKEPTSYTLF